ncbi:MAG TPA: hypothetical protein VGQ99_17385 [Tepidisphaeraceae bacterium]|jgi:hypothetical protein|nr:hypothetical protein [Tepidisphaeraceae bacterium]
MPRSKFCASWICLCALLTARAGAQPANTYPQKLRTFHTAQEFDRITAGKIQIQRRLDPKLQIALREAIMNWPSTQFTVIAVKSPSVTWVGTRQGAIRLSQNYQSLEFFSASRWLPDDHVTGIGFDGDATWLETPRGFSRIEYKPMTLADKSRVFVDRVQKRHNRWGLTADSNLRVAGDVSTNQMISTDNDGLWTAIYVAAECFRYKVTGDADARENARRGMQAIIRLESITGKPGFPARSFIKVGHDLPPGDGEWHDTPDKIWRWKGDTSSDEIVGHYFVYPIYLDLAADEDEKPTLRAVIDRITNHILDNNYQLVDLDGKRTTWGFWGPEAIWEDADETGIRALHILSHLRVALYMTSDAQNRAKFQAACDDLIKTHKYHLLTRNQKIMIPGLINHSDDELAFLSYYPLLRYETDPKLLEVYKQSLARSWQCERAERNPLWNFIYAAGAGAREFDRPESLRTLHEIPMDTIEWSVHNSHRLDVPIDLLGDRFQRRQALIVLPYDELPMSKWNGNPFTLDGGGGHSEDDGAYFLLPYWMGRYHKLIGE